MNYLNLVGTTDRYRIKQGYRSIRHRCNERLLYVILQPLHRELDNAKEAVAIRIKFMMISSSTSDLRG